MNRISDRSYEPIARADLDRLATLATADREARFTRRPRWSIYGHRTICIALCQGGALHYVDGKCGIKDIDAWTFSPNTRQGHSPTAG